MEPENELIAQRREKLEALRARGVEPFGRAFETSGSIAEVRHAFKEGESLRAGRHRKNGTACRTSKHAIGSDTSIWSRTSNRGRHFKNASRSCAKFADSWKIAVLRKWRRQFYKRSPAARRRRRSARTTKRSG